MSNLRQKSLNWLTLKVYPLDANTTNVNFISAGCKLHPVTTSQCHRALEGDKAPVKVKKLVQKGFRLWIWEQGPAQLDSMDLPL